MAGNYFGGNDSSEYAQTHLAHAFLKRVYSGAIDLFRTLYTQQQLMVTVADRYSTTMLIITTYFIYYLLYYIQYIHAYIFLKKGYSGAIDLYGILYTTMLAGLWRRKNLYCLF